MTVQTSYTQDPVVGQEGLLADSAPHIIISRKAKEALGFGRLVVFGAGDTEEGCSYPDSAAEITNLSWGVTVKDPSKASQGGYVTDDDVMILQLGKIWMQAEDALTALTNPFVRHTNGGGGTEHGRLRSDADTATAGQSTQLQVEKGSSGAGLVKVNVNTLT